VRPVTLIGNDGEGYELRQALGRLGVVDPAHLVPADDRRTPTYTKPMLFEENKRPRELNRLDIKNRAPLPHRLENSLLTALEEVWPGVDALVVLDQVAEPNCGVLTERVRRRLAELGKSQPGKFVLADSRARIGDFRFVSLKPNEAECRQAMQMEAQSLAEVATALSNRSDRSVFCTCGGDGILLAEPCSTGPKCSQIPAYRVDGPIDIVGAGDSASAAIACAVGGGATFAEAAAFGCLVASITIQQIGTTGTATPAQIRNRWREVS
jgi:bifunctional ADP-heptose synthase (sugar kinase/adenylyltransferase)